MRFTTTKLQPVETLDAIQCDCCRRRFEADDILEIQEFLHIDFPAGYGSVFGDENHVQADICQQCLKDRLGECLRITDPTKIRKTPKIAGLPRPGVADPSVTPPLLRKRAGAELDKGPRNPILSGFLEEELSRLRAEAQPPAKTRDTATLDRLYVDMLREVNGPPLAT